MLKRKMPKIRGLVLISFVVRISLLLFFFLVLAFVSEAQSSTSQLAITESMTIENPEWLLASTEVKHVSVIK